MKKKSSIWDFFRPKTGIRKKDSIVSLKARALFRRTKSMLFNIPQKEQVIVPTTNVPAYSDETLNPSIDGELSRSSVSSINTKYKVGYSSSNCKIQDVNVKPSDFQKIELIGRGDVGKVYLVEHRTSNQLFAMKILSKREMLTRDKVKRVLAEQRILATANHPFIVPLHHTFETLNNLYFITEYCSGGEFFRTLQKLPDKCLTEHDSKFYIAEVVCALEFLHLMGFIYRDLKPENILLHATGHIMLADFDLSKPSKADRSPLMLRTSTMNLKKNSNSNVLDTRACTATIRTNSFVGTEEYIAPEIVSGRGHSSAVDWWTLGILLYEMVYGCTPFRGHNRRGTFANIVHLDVKFPRRNAISSQCRQFIKQLLIKDEYKRLGSRAGAADVKNHSFFSDINWALLRNMTPPIIPYTSNRLDTSNFRTIDDDDGIDLENESIFNNKTTENPFKDFESVSISREE